MGKRRNCNNSTITNSKKGTLCLFQSTKRIGYYEIKTNTQQLNHIFTKNNIISRTIWLNGKNATKCSECKSTERITNGRLYASVIQCIWESDQKNHEIALSSAAERWPSLNFDLLLFRVELYTCLVAQRTI